MCFDFFIKPSSKASKNYAGNNKLYRKHMCIFLLWRSREVYNDLDNKIYCSKNIVVFDWLVVCLFNYKNRSLTQKYKPVDFQTLHIFTESCSKCPRIVNPVGLFEPDGEDKTFLRIGGSCLLLHTMQHPRSGWETYVYHRYSNWRKYAE